MSNFIEELKKKDSKELIRLLESNMRTRNNSEEGSLSHTLSSYGIESIRTILGNRFMNGKLQNKELSFNE